MSDQGDVYSLQVILGTETKVMIVLSSDVAVKELLDRRSKCDLFRQTDRQTDRS